MDKPHTPLTKTCISCGLLRPLNAFLEISSQDGVLYGNICAICRKGEIEKAKSTPSEMSTSSGSVIDTRSKVKADMDKRDLHNKVEENYHEERDEKEEQQQEKIEKTSTVTQEKKRVESFLEKRAYQQAAQESKRFNTEAVVGSEADNEEKSKIDYRGDFVDTQITGKLTHSSVIRKQGSLMHGFQNWLGKGNLVAGGDKPKQNKEAPKVDDKSLNEFAKNTWRKK